MENKQGTDLLQLVSAHRRGVMGVAAILIYLFHKHSLVFTGQLLSTIEYRCQRLLFFGVDLFFLMAGLGLTYAIRKETLLTFWYRRLKRIALPFLVIGAIAAIMEQWDAATVIGNLSGYYFYAKSMYSFMWFFPAIATLYLLFPLYHKLMQLSKSPLVFTGIVLCLWLLGSLLLAAPMKTIERQEFYGFTNRIPIFLIGVLFGELAHTRKLNATLPGWILLVLIGMVGGYLAYQTSFKQMPLLVPVPNCCVPNILLAISSVFIFAGIFDLLSRVRVGRWIEKAFGLLGLISLELYAAQRITKIKWAADLPWGGYAVLKNLTAFLMTLAIAVALYWLNRGFWALSELPFKKKKA